MTKNDAIDYINTKFEYKEIKKIHGEPEYESIKILFDQIKANAASVPSDLGGGSHGHLGLVLTPEKYALVSNEPFKRPEHPGTLDIPARATAPQIAAAQDDHTEAMRVFREVLNVEAALRQQIVSAIEDKYLKAIRNRTTNAITMSVSDIIMVHLFGTYGSIDPDKLETEEKKVKEATYDPREPIDELYLMIEDLVDMSEAANCPYTQNQTINMGYIILRRTGQFTDSLKTWIRKAQNQKTWINFKVHFSTAQRELKQLGLVTLGDTMQFQQANIIQQMVLAAVQEAVSENKLVPAQVQEPTQVPTENPFQTANATRQDTLLPLLIQQVQSMQETMNNLQRNMSNQQNNSYRNFPSNTINNNNNNMQQRNTRDNRANLKYCWTHGCCYHSGKECTRKAQGHKEEATFENRLGGNNKGNHKYQKMRQTN